MSNKRFVFTTLAAICLGIGLTLAGLPILAVASLALAFFLGLLSLGIK